ncbi:MAG: ADP-ribosylglycohydrolase family protein [Actinobacteria bacterium]|nr:ADP-ribosylglycohydrolase family protein [Actinomycetota bacterium]
MPIRYPDPVNWQDDLNHWVRLKAEYGATGLDEKLDEIRQLLESQTAEVMALQEEPDLAISEPDDLEGIRLLRPSGSRRIWDEIPIGGYRDRLEGALLGRCAGCTLGAPVEFYSIGKMARWADHIGDPFPPVRYWSAVERPHDLAYKVSPRWSFTPDRMDGVPTDDDIAYTLLGLLILEDHGPDFTTADVGSAWLEYLPYAHTAEEVALANLRRGVSADEAGSIDNPFVQFIGGDIRSDPWAYATPGFPEKAAELAHRDAFLTHRRNGIYAEMFFSAVISVAFAVDDAVDAVRIGLEEIPRNCRLAQEVRWALETASEIHDYRDANAAVTERFGGMHGAHAINNAILTIWGLTIGGRDFTKVIGETVAMSYDNDCTAATAGSIAGAILGRDGIPEHWWVGFNNKVYSYLNGHAVFAIDDLVDRFAAQAVRAAQAGA